MAAAWFDLLSGVLASCTRGSFAANAARSSAIEVGSNCVSGNAVGSEHVAAQPVGRSVAKVAASEHSHPAREQQDGKQQRDRALHGVAP